MALLQEMGLEAKDVRPLRKAGMTGAELLLLDEDQLMDLLGLPKQKARRLRRLQVGKKMASGVLILGSCCRCTVDV